MEYRVSTLETMLADLKAEFKNSQEMIMMQMDALFVAFIVIEILLEFRHLLIIMHPSASPLYHYPVQRKWLEVLRSNKTNNHTAAFGCSIRNGGTTTMNPRYITSCYS
ncbi:hypothetical protein ACFX16_006359 [Malus domestica]